MVTFFVKNQNRAISQPIDRNLEKLKYCAWCLLKLVKFKNSYFCVLPDIRQKCGHCSVLQILVLNISKTTKWPYLGYMAGNKENKGSLLS